MKKKVVLLMALAVMIYAPEQIQSARTGNGTESMPLFNDLSSPGDNGELRIKVTFANSVEDILILSQVPGTTIYEGYLQKDHESPVLLIDTPVTKKRLIALSSENVPKCRYFDIDLTTDNIECIPQTHRYPTWPMINPKIEMEHPINEGPIIYLGNDYAEGIFVKMLFIFTRKFYEEFDGVDGKTAEEYFQVLIKIVQNSFKDKTMRNEIGTVVQIVADIKIYEGDLEWYEPYINNKTFSDLDPVLQQVTNEIGGDYDLYMYVRHSGIFPFGKADLGSVCDENGYKFMSYRAYGPEQCQFCFLSQEMCFQLPLDCSATNRLLLTAEGVAHEIGHALGMHHDGIIRKYQNETCRGLMDYFVDGVAWSKCSMMDFSRYLAPKFPCLKGEK